MIIINKTGLLVDIVCLFVCVLLRDNDDDYDCYGVGKIIDSLTNQTKK